MANILVIDDSPTVFASLQEQLSDHVLSLMKRFIDLPQQIRQAPPELILLDLELPSLSGVQLGQYIRKYEPFPIPIIIHSSRPLEELRVAARQVGAVDSVQKGMDAAELRRRIERALLVRV